MAHQASRAYKLQLSDAGMQLFLDDHCRLCHLVGDLLSYGSTLFVAVHLLHLCPGGEMANALLDPELHQLGGRKIRHVGTSRILSDLVHSIAAEIETAGVIYSSPQVWKIFLAALLHMRDAEDVLILRSYHLMLDKIKRSAR